MRFLEGQSSSDARGLLAAVKDTHFLFGLEFLRELFVSVNATSEALQSSDTDLAAAATAIGSLKSCVSNMRNNHGEFERLYLASGVESLTLSTTPYFSKNYAVSRYIRPSSR